MNQQDLGLFRKTLITIMSVAFTGVLLVYTGIANLNLLTTTYPDPQFVMFGMVALEGGVLYWTGYYLLHRHGVHKAIAVSMAVVDFVFSMVGFFLDINLHTGNVVRTALPPVVIVMAIDVAINVGFGILVHFMSHGGHPTVQPMPQPLTRYAAYPHDSSVDEERRTTALKEGATATPFDESQSQLPQYVPMILAQSARVGKRSNRSTPPLLSRLGTAMRVLNGSVVAQVQAASPPVQESEQEAEAEVEQEPTTA